MFPAHPRPRPAFSQQHAALPAFTKVVNPYSRPKTPAGAESALLGGKLSPTSSSGAPSVVLAAPAVALGSTTTGRHPFQPTDAWRKTFLDHFLDLRAVGSFLCLP
jgi:hypothetical protein